MTATIFCSISYPAADFTTSGGNFNLEILKQEAIDAGLTVDVAGVIPSGDGARFDLVGLPTGADKTALDGVVSAHSADSFTDPADISAISEAESDDSGDSGAVQVKVPLDTGKLRAGPYIATWNLEVYLNAESSTSWVKGAVNIGKNGGEKAERGMVTNFKDINHPATLGSSIGFVAKDGESYQLELTFQQLGVVDNVAKARRARLSIVPVTP